MGVECRETKRERRRSHVEKPALYLIVRFPTTCFCVLHLFSALIRLKSKLRRELYPSWPTPAKEWVADSHVTRRGDLIGPVADFARSVRVGYEAAGAGRVDVRRRIGDECR